MIKKSFGQDRSLMKEMIRSRYLFLMILPAAVFFVVFSYLPMAGIYLAFTNFNFHDGFWGSPFCGLANFRFLFSSGTAMTITRNTILYNIAFIVFGSFTSILAAVLLSEIRQKVFKKVTQTIIFLPYFISFVLVAAFIYNIFNYEYGVLNSMLAMFGVESVNIYDDPAKWKYIIILLHIWKQVGYGTVIYLAAITSIPHNLYEAAEVDGANIYQKIQHITIPHIIPTFVLILIFNVGSIMRGQFDLFYNIVGNNGLLYNATDVIDTYVYRSLIVNFDIGMASAAGVYQSVVGLVVVLAVNNMIRKLHPEYALF